MKLILVNEETTLSAGRRTAHALRFAGRCQAPGATSDNSLTEKRKSGEGQNGRLGDRARGHRGL